MLAAGLFLPERWLQPFRSVRVNIWLFTLIAAVSILGTFFPDANIYHEPWFAMLLALMAFNVVACKLRRGPLLIHGTPGTREERSLDRFFARSRFRATVSTTQSPLQAAVAARAWLRALGLRFQEGSVRAADGGEAVAFFAARHRLQRWGDLILHVSIVAILAGALMGALYGFDEMLPVPEGETMRMKSRPLDVTLEDFDMRYYASTGQVSSYASSIVVRQDGLEIGRKRVVVNDPLDIKRIRFYQASWGISQTFKAVVLRIGGRDVTVRPGETVDLGETGMSVRANRIAPTFSVRPDGRPEIVDFQGHNPALQLDFLDKGEVRVAVWLMYRRPEAYRIEGDRVTAAPAPPFQWVAFDPILFSGIQVGYDPGAPLFWLGSIFLMAGLCAHFYLHQRRLRIAVLPKGGGSEIVVGGWNSRAAAEFEAEFEGWVGRLRREVS